MIYLHLAMAGLFKQVLGYFKNRCLLCLQSTSRLDQALCSCCFHDLPSLPITCRCCGEPHSHPQFICGRCQQRPPYFTATLAAFPYRPPIQGVIARFKFNGDLACGDLLGRLLASHIRHKQQAVGNNEFILDPPLLLPVPLHTSRLRQRQFNQAQLLAQIVARELNLSIANGLCQRIKATESQRQLNIQARAANVRDAFAVTRRLNGENIAIIDDVMTTGATVNEIAKALKSAGAGRIEVWCLARAEPPR